MTLIDSSSSEIHNKCIIMVSVSRVLTSKVMVEGNITATYLKDRLKKNVHICDQK